MIRGKRRLNFDALLRPIAWPKFIPHHFGSVTSSRQNYLRHCWWPDIKLQDHLRKAPWSFDRGQGYQGEYIFLLLEDFMLPHNEASMSKHVPVKATGFSKKIQWSTHAGYSMADSIGS